jgi:Helix-turn-helix domain
MRPHREKAFRGFERTTPLDRNAKARVMVYARALMRRTEAGKHYGLVTAKYLAVLGALLWGFHNQHTGRCYPSYETIADRAGCARSTVYAAIRALENVGVLTWVNRIARVREPFTDLFGDVGSRWRIVRTSNAYSFVDPNPCKSERSTGTALQDSIPCAPPLLHPTDPLHRALSRLGDRVKIG